jgi:hypothetical protein
MLIGLKAVPPKTAFQIIGVGVTKGYELLADGELESFTIGRARRVTVASIDAFVERRLSVARQAA